jgi:hypothetical protein
MITCTFNGRLGNNLFQTATTISIANKLNCDFVLPVTTWAGHRGHRPVDLSMFAYNFIRKENEDVNLSNSYNDPDFHYTPITVELNTRLSGFYQSWRYFEDIRQELLGTYFAPSNKVCESLAKYNITPNSLGISVRRGDYLMLQQNHCVLSTTYYQDVINTYFSNNIDSVYIFSDDLEWCSQVFGPDVHYVQDSIGAQLFLMSRMKHLILSNSTFAWWGAYLNTQQGTIVAPDPWFGPAYADKNTKDLYYPTWIKHKHEAEMYPFEITPNMVD